MVFYYNTGRKNEKKKKYGFYVKYRRNYGKSRQYRKEWNNNMDQGGE